jgi:hypothetical protein
MGRTLLLPNALLLFFFFYLVILPLVAGKELDQVRFAPKLNQQTPCRPPAGGVISSTNLILAGRGDYNFAILSATFDDRRELLHWCTRG